MTTTAGRPDRGYLIPDLAQTGLRRAREARRGQDVDARAWALVVKDAEGEVQVQETGDHLGRKGVKVGGGAGLVVGLFAPPLLAATAVGGGRRRHWSGSSRGTGWRAASATRWTTRFPRVGRHHRDLRHERPTPSQGARERDQKIGRAGRRGRRQRTQSRPRRSAGRHGRVSLTQSRRGASGTRARRARLREVRSQP